MKSFDSKILLLLFVSTIVLSGVTTYPHTVYTIDGSNSHSKSFNKIGNHVIVEFTECKNLNAFAELEDALARAANAAGATLLTVKTHQFSPAGMTGVAVLAESHISVHTWPEFGYAAVDIFTCGEHVDVYKAFYVLREFFQANDMALIKIDRGFNA